MIGSSFVRPGLGLCCDYCPVDNMRSLNERLAHYIFVVVIKTMEIKLNTDFNSNTILFRLLYRYRVGEDRKPLSTINRNNTISHILVQVPLHI